MALLAIIEKLYHSILAGSENRIEERTHFEDREVDVVVRLGPRDAQGARGRPRRARAAPRRPPSERTDTIELTPAGLSLVRRAQPRPDAARRAEDDPEFERWRVHDLSSQRLRPPRRPRRQPTTMLLNGLHRAAQPRDRRLDRGQRRAQAPNRVRGEMLAGRRGARVPPGPGGARAARRRRAVQAIYLPGTDTNGKQDSLLVRAGRLLLRPSAFALRAGGRRLTACA